MTKEEYYTAPPDHIFDAVKRVSMEVWQAIASAGGDAYECNESLERIEQIENVKDNAWYIVAMFDQGNQNRLVYALRAIGYTEAAEKVADVIKGVV